jgi:glycosyltransferase 2 family protein
LSNARISSRTGAGSAKGRLIWRRRLIALVKVALATLLVSGLFYYDVITLAALKATFGKMKAATGAFTALALACVLSALRWYFILHALGIPIRLRPCAEIFAMGTFANNLMLGGTGGDVVRAVYVSMHLHRDRAGGVISVLLDRAAGLLGMLTLAVVFGVIDAAHVVDSPVTRAVFLSLCGGFVAGLAGIIVLFVVMKPEFHARTTARLGTRTVFHRVILRLFETVVQLRQNPVAVIVAFTFSLATTLLVVVAIMFFASGFEAGGLSWIDYGNATIIALLASAIPITPGGIGMAEGAFALLCRTWQLHPMELAYGSIFFAQRLTMTVISLIGCIAFVTYQGGRTEMQAPETHPAAG